MFFIKLLFFILIIYIFFFLSSCFHLTNLNNQTLNQFINSKSVSTSFKSHSSDSSTLFKTENSLLNNFKNSSQNLDLNRLNRKKIILYSSFSTPFPINQTKLQSSTLATLTVLQTNFHETASVKSAKKSSDRLLITSLNELSTSFLDKSTKNDKIQDLEIEPTKPMINLTTDLIEKIFIVPKTNLTLELITRSTTDLIKESTTELTTKPSTELKTESEINLNKKSTTEITTNLATESTTKPTNSATESTTKPTAELKTEPTIDSKKKLTTEITRNLATESTTKPARQSKNDTTNFSKLFLQTTTDLIKNPLTTIPIQNTVTIKSTPSPFPKIDNSTKSTTLSPFSNLTPSLEPNSSFTTKNVISTTLPTVLTTTKTPFINLNFDDKKSDILVVSSTNFTIPCTIEQLLDVRYLNLNYSISLNIMKQEYYNVFKRSRLQDVNLIYSPVQGLKVNFLSNSSILNSLLDKISRIECELNYFQNSQQKTTIYKTFTLIYLGLESPRLSNEHDKSFFYQLYSSNDTLTRVVKNETIILECLVITYKEALSKYGFLWRKNTINKEWNFTKYQDTKKTYDSIYYQNKDSDQIFKVVRTELKISNIDLIDSGYHYCDYDSDSVRKSYGIFVEVVDAVPSKSNLNKADEMNVFQQKSFITFESEHSTDNPLIVKPKETFLLRIKINFNQKCNMTYFWLRRMKPFDNNFETINGLANYSIAVSNKIETADIKDSGEYTLIVIKNDENNSFLNFINLYKNISNSQKTENINTNIEHFLLNEFISQKFEFNLKTILVKVEGEAELNVFKSEKFYLNNYYSAVCHVFSTIPTSLYWVWSFCLTDEECFAQNITEWKFISNKIYNQDLPDFQGQINSGNNETYFKLISINNEQLNILDFNFQKEITYACLSVNALGTTKVLFRVLKSEIDLSISVSRQKVFNNDNLTLSCTGIFYQKQNLQWLYQKNINSTDMILSDKNTKNYFIQTNYNKKNIDDFDNEILKSYLEFIRYKVIYFISSQLIIDGVQSNQNGLYRCKNEFNNKESTLYFLNIEKSIPAKIINLASFYLTTKIIIVCKYLGNPIPSVTWYKDSNLFDGKIVSDAFESKLILDYENVIYESYYGCEVSNRWSKEMKNVFLQKVQIQLPQQNNEGLNQIGDQNNQELNNVLPNKKGNHTNEKSSFIFSRNGVIVILMILIIFMIIYTLFQVKCKLKKSSIRNRLFKKSSKAKNNFGFAFYNTNIRENNLDCINSFFNVSNNNEINNDSLLINKLLKSIEFPVERLELGRVIGQGAYGVVVKGEAIGIKKSIKMTTVAIKMLKDENDIDQRTSLISEIKTLLFLGKHLNIINLLGVVTKNNRLMAIIEYCRFGNMKNFLLANRLTFVNMVNIETGDLDVDYNVVKLDVSNSSKDSGFSVKISLKTLDLISFTFQIARGMQYIHSKKLLHRDLAARNILVTENFVIKICDFGLSKDIYFNELYVNKGDGKLPVKWMAYESIVDQIFTFKSDVWSFAIVCWEIFSLGSNPYPGVQIDENFTKKLLTGYRMERPEKCPNTIYKLMNDCWKLNPDLRPYFDTILSRIYELLDVSTKNSYIDFNEQAIDLN